MKLLRIKFEKTGLAKYISHLDLNRVFARALARAKIDVAHSEGFNPRPKIVFASAISLGMESLCEFADIKTSETQIFEKIKNVFPDGINILEVYEPENNFKNIDSTRFHIYIKTSEQIDTSFDIVVEKKPGININLKDYILESVLTESGEYKLIDITVKTNPEMYLNPENIIKGINNIEDYFIRKIEVHDKNNTIFR